jgi:hypothetical protein
VTSSCAIRSVQEHGQLARRLDVTQSRPLTTLLAVSQKQAPGYLKRENVKTLFQNVKTLLFSAKQQLLARTRSFLNVSAPSSSWHYQISLFEFLRVHILCCRQRDFFHKTPWRSLARSLAVTVLDSYNLTLPLNPTPRMRLV